MTTILLVHLNPLIEREWESEGGDELGKLFEAHLREGPLLSSSGLFILFPCPVMTGATCSKGTKRAFCRRTGSNQKLGYRQTPAGFFSPCQWKALCLHCGSIIPTASKPGQAPPISDADCSSSAQLCFLVQMQLHTLHRFFECLLILSWVSLRAARHFFQMSCFGVWISSSPRYYSFINH